MYSYRPSYRPYNPTSNASDLHQIAASIREHFANEREQRENNSTDETESRLENGGTE